MLGRVGRLGVTGGWAGLRKWRSNQKKVGGKHRKHMEKRWKTVPIGIFGSKTFWKPKLIGKSLGELLSVTQWSRMHWLKDAKPILKSVLRPGKDINLPPLKEETNYGWCRPLGLIETLWHVWPFNAGGKKSHFNGCWLREQRRKEVPLANLWELNCRIDAEELKRTPYSSRSL